MAGKREMVTEKQRAKIWACTYAQGMEETRLREIIERASGQRSTKALTKRQAIKVIEALEGTGTLPVPKGNSKVITLITPAQIHLIEQLKTESGWTDEHLASYILKYYKRDNLRKLTRSHAGVVINILKKAKQKREAA